MAELKLRLPEALRKKIERAALQNHQSMNTEMIERLNLSFDGGSMAYTAEQKRAALERELKWRVRVYATRVMTGRMTQQKFNYEIDILRAMLLDYETLAEKEKLL